MIALFATMFLAACNENKTTEPPTGGMAVSSKTVQLSEVGDVYTLVLTSPSPWKSTVNLEAREWLSVKPATGGGGSGMEIAITATPYIDGQSREAVVTFELVDGTGKIPVKFTRGKAAIGRQSDSNVLVALYEATKGNWKIRWDFNAPIDTWDSIRTEVIDGQLRVVEINLANVRLNTNKRDKKPLPENINYLSELRVLDLSQEPHNNDVVGSFNIMGAIPASLSEIKTLRKIDLSYNTLTGGIPAGILDNPNLEILRLQLNDLKGTIPAELANAKALKELRLGKLGLTGTIPAALSELTNLEVIDLSHNKLTGAIPSLNALTKLQYFDIAYNAKYVETWVDAADQEGYGYNKYVEGGLDGTVEFNDLPDLDYASVIGCNLKSSPKVKNCPKLRYFLASNNAIGALDPSIFNIPSCTDLYLSNAGITSLPEVTDLSNLSQLLLDYNYITTIPESLKKATKLTLLYLDVNEFEVLPDIFGNMTLLKDFRMAHGKDGTTVPAYTGKVKSLPASLWKLPSLEILLIQMNVIEGELPARMQELAKTLTVMNLGLNKFSGSIHGVADLKRAELILLSVNQFTGTLPENIGNLLQVSAFAVDDNYLTGGIPESVVKCVRLKDFHLMTNCFAGVVPYIVFSDSRWGNPWLTNLITPQRDGYRFDIQVTPPKN